MDKKTFKETWDEFRKNFKPTEEQMNTLGPFVNYVMQKLQYEESQKNDGKTDTITT